MSLSLSGRLTISGRRAAGYYGSRSGERYCSSNTDSDVSATWYEADTLEAERHETGLYLVFYGSHQRKANGSRIRRVAIFSNGDDDSDIAEVYSLYKLYRNGYNSKKDLISGRSCSLHYRKGEQDLTMWCRFDTNQNRFHVISDYPTYETL